MWSVVQVPTDPIKSASAGCHYYIEDDEQFALCRGDLETILRSIAAEEFYDVMDFHVIDDLEKFNINIGR